MRRILLEVVIRHEVNQQLILLFRGKRHFVSKSLFEIDMQATSSWTVLFYWLNLLSYFHDLEGEKKNKTYLFCINISGLILAMSSSCYVWEETLWICHLMKTLIKKKCVRMFLFHRCAAAAHLHNVNSFSFFIIIIFVYRFAFLLFWLW